MNYSSTALKLFARRNKRVIFKFWNRTENIICKKIFQHYVPIYNSIGDFFILSIVFWSIALVKLVYYCIQFFYFCATKRPLNSIHMHEIDDVKCQI